MLARFDIMVVTYRAGSKERRACGHNWLWLLDFWLAAAYGPLELTES
jgi:hypothetical protein